MSIGTSIPIAQAEVVLTLNTALFKPALQSALKSPPLSVSTAQAERDIARFTIATSRSLKSVGKLIIEASAPAVALGGLSIASFLKQGSAEAKRYELALAGVKDAQARIGGVLLNMRIGGKDSAQWVQTFGDYLNKLSPEKIERIAKIFTTGMGIGISLKLLGEFLHIYERLSKVGILGEKVYNNSFGNTMLATSSPNVVGNPYVPGSPLSIRDKGIRLDTNTKDITKYNIRNSPVVQYARTSIQAARRAIEEGRNMDINHPDYEKKKAIAEKALRKVKRDFYKFRIAQHGASFGKGGINEKGKLYGNVAQAGVFGVSGMLTEPIKANLSKFSLGLENAAIGLVNFIGKIGSIAMPIIGIGAAAFGGYMAGGYIRDTKNKYGESYGERLDAMIQGETTNKTARILRGFGVLGWAIGATLPNRKYGIGDSLELNPEQREERRAMRENSETNIGYNKYMSNLSEKGFNEIPEITMNDIILRRNKNTENANKFPINSNQREFWEKQNEGSEKKLETLNKLRNSIEHYKVDNVLEKVKAQQGEYGRSGLSMEEILLSNKELGENRKGVGNALATSSNSLKQLEDKGQIGSLVFNLELDHKNKLQSKYNELLYEQNSLLGKASSIIKEETNFGRSKNLLRIEAAKLQRDKEYDIKMINKDLSRSIEDAMPRKPLSKDAEAIGDIFGKMIAKGDIKGLTEASGKVPEDILNELVKEKKGSLNTIGLTDLSSFMAQSINANKPDIGGIAGMMRGAKRGIDNINDPDNSRNKQIADILEKILAKPMTDMSITNADMAEAMKAMKNALVEPAQ